MKQSTKNLLRNLIHPYALSFIFYFLGIYLNISYEMTREGDLITTVLQMILISLFASIPAGLLGVIYEIPYKLWTLKEPADINDVWRSALGGPIGFGLACLFPFLPNWFVYGNLLIVGVLFLYDLYRTIKNIRTK